jgi:hypothetical protein
VTRDRAIPMKQRWPAILYRVLELAVVVVTYLVLGLILFRIVTWIFQ